MPRVTLSVAIITLNEEENLPRTLESVKELVRAIDGEIVIVDSGSTDRTLEIAHQYGAKVFSEAWKGFAAQKNSAIAKCSGDWILSLDADESLERACAQEILWALVLDMARSASGLEGALKATRTALEWQYGPSKHNEDWSDWEKTIRSAASRQRRDIVGYFIPRKNFFLGRWIRHGGFYPDRKLRLIRRGAGQWVEHGAHPTIQVNGPTANLKHAMLHYAYPTLQGYIAHMNSYSTMQAEHLNKSRSRGFDLLNIVINPMATFLYNYIFRLGFLDGREGLVLHLYHSAYVSWKYAKAWELNRKS